MTQVLFLESSSFARWVRKHKLEPALERLKRQLVLDPDAGDVIPKGAGLRKVRMAGGGRGKRGGFRVIYILLLARSAVAFLDGYAKSEQEDLNATQLKRLMASVASLEAQALAMQSAQEESGNGKTQATPERPAD